MALVKYVFQEFPITLEYRKGETRTGTSADGKPWARKMHADYGYIRRTTGLDDEPCDVYVGTDAEAKFVYAVTQLKAPEFAEVDEQKFMLGFPSLKAAKETYLAHYPDPAICGAVKALPLEEFREKVMATKDEAKKIAKRIVDHHYATRDKESGALFDGTIGMLIGGPVGRLTAVATKRDVHQADLRGSLLGGVGGVLRADSSRAGKVFLDVAHSAATGGLGDVGAAACRGAVEFAPEIAGGVVGGLSSRRNNEIPRYIPSSGKYAELFNVIDELPEGEKQAVLGALSRLTGAATKAVRGVGQRLRSAMPVPKPPAPPKAVVPPTTTPTGAPRTGGRSTAPPAVGKVENSAATTVKPTAAPTPVASSATPKTPASPKLMTPGRMLGAAAMGTTALGLYGGYKGINAAAGLVEPHHGEYVAPSVGGLGRPF